MTIAYSYDISQLSKRLLGALALKIRYAFPDFGRWKIGGEQKNSK